MKLLILIAYFIVLITIGFVCRQKATDVNGFVLGGRSVGPWLTAFAYGTSYFSAVVFVGYAGQDKPYISPPKKQKIFVNQIAVGTCWQYQLGVDSGKEIIMDNLRVQTPGQKYCHFPKRDDYGSAYFAGLLSETKVYDPNKKQPWSWKKIPGHERNEPLDCRNYALAAFKALPKNLDEIDRQIKAASGVRVPAPPSANITPPKRRTAQRGRQKYYDDW